jgi:hypothetical protein
VGVGDGVCVEVVDGSDVGAPVVGVCSGVGKADVGLGVGKPDVGRGEGCSIGAVFSSAATVDRPVRPTRERIPTVKSAYAVICIRGISLSLFSIWLRDAQCGYGRLGR